MFLCHIRTYMFRTFPFYPLHYDCLVYQGVCKNSLRHLLSGLIVMLFQQDATSSRRILTLQYVLVFLDRKLPWRWIVRSIPVSWSLRSRGLTPLDFFFLVERRKYSLRSTIVHRLAGTSWDDTSCCSYIYTDCTCRRVD